MRPTKEPQTNNPYQDPTTLFTSFASTSTLSICTSTVTIPVAPSIISVDSSCANIPSLYTTPNGKQFHSDCGNFYATNSVIERAPQNSFTSCIRRCSVLDNCVAITWIPQEPEHNCVTLYALATSYSTVGYGFVSALLVV
jgi:hypothetical protein